MIILPLCVSVCDVGDVSHMSILPYLRNVIGMLFMEATVKKSDHDFLQTSTAVLQRKKQGTVTADLHHP